MKLKTPDDVDSAVNDLTNNLYDCHKYKFFHPLYFQPTVINYKNNDN